MDNYKITTATCQQRCLVLGGNGFIGSHLIKTLLNEGYQVRVFDKAIDNRINEGSLFNIEWFEGDFVNEADIDKAMLGCDIVFHLISTTLPKSSNEDPIYDVQTNLIGTLKILELAVKHKIKKIIFPSSGGTVYGIPTQTPIQEFHSTNPICSYGITKLAIEKYLQLFYLLHQLDYCVLRISNPYGEGQRIQSTQGAIAVFIGKMLNGETIEIWGDGTIVRDYIHIDDVCSALVKAIAYTGNHKIFNIGSGEGKSLNRILSLMEKHIKTSIQKTYKSARALDVPVNILDISLANKELNWKPALTFEQGIGRTVNYYKNIG